MTKSLLLPMVVMVVLANDGSSAAYICDTLLTSASMMSREGHLLTIFRSDGLGHCL